MYTYYLLGMYKHVNQYPLHELPRQSNTRRVANEKVPTTFPREFYLCFRSVDGCVQLGLLFTCRRVYNHHTYIPLYISITMYTLYTYLYICIRICVHIRARCLSPSFCLPFPPAGLCHTLFPPRPPRLALHLLPLSLLTPPFLLPPVLIVVGERRGRV